MDIIKDTKRITTKLDNYTIRYQRLDKETGDTIMDIIYRNIDDPGTDPEQKPVDLCTVYALSVLLGLSVEETYRLEAEYGIKNRCIMNYLPSIYNILEDNGFTPSENYNGRSCFKDKNKVNMYKEIPIYEFIMNYNSGKYFLTVVPKEKKYRASHCLALIDGVLYEHAFSTNEFGVKKSREKSWHLYMGNIFQRLFKEDYYVMFYAYKED